MSMTINESAVVDEESFTVRRTISIAAPIEKVWSAVTDPAHISQWFGQAAFEGASAGSRGTLTWEGRDPIPVRIEAIDAPTDDQKRTMRYWRRRLASAQLAPPPPADAVGFGSAVTFTLNGKNRELHIVGEDEAHPAAGLLALSAPLAQALIGAGEGDVLPFGGREDAIEVVSIG